MIPTVLKALTIAALLCSLPSGEGYAKIVKPSDISSTAPLEVSLMNAPAPHSVERQPAVLDLKPVVVVAANPMPARTKTHISSHPRPRPRIDAKRVGDWKAVYGEARNLLIPDQKYLLRFEEEDTYGTMGLSSANSGNLTTTFSSQDVQRFQKAVDGIERYREQMRMWCVSPSSQALALALDKYALALCSFHRRALPLVADISENNNVLVLLVNRTALRDSTVLISRYLQFKKQRFKDGMSRFLTIDQQLTSDMVEIAKMLKVALADNDWNGAYGLRENALELISLWPRDTIYEATTKLADARESACIPAIPVVVDTTKGGSAKAKAE